MKVIVSEHTMSGRGMFLSLHKMKEWKFLIENQEVSINLSFNSYSRVYILWDVANK